MRLSNRLLLLGGVIVLFAAVWAEGAPTTMQAKEGTGPSGKMESTFDFYPPEPEYTGPPRTTKPIGLKKETAEEAALMARLKNLQLEVGHDVARVLQAPPLSRSGGSDGLAAAPPLTSSFEGITMGAAGNFIPPDPIMAAGPSHVIVAVNLRWNIYNKTGTQQFTTSFASWFSSVNTRAEGFSDPKVMYDHYSGRWIVMCIGFGTSPNNVGSYFISVSDDSDPNGFWYKWASPAELDGSTVTGNFPDYPGVGYDSSEAVYLSSRQFPVAGGGFQYAKVRILKKSELYRTDSMAPALTYSDFIGFTDLTTGTNSLTMKPAMCWGPIQGNFVVGSVNGSGSAHDIWRINNPAGAATMTRIATIPLGAFSAPPNAAQPPPGCATLVNTVDARITGEVTYRDGQLYYVFNHAHNFGSGTVGAIRYVRMDTTVSLLDNIIYGADGEFMYFPNVTVSKSGKVGIGYSHSSTAAGHFPSARYVGNFPDDLAQGVLRAGDGAYCIVAGGRNRWGDYSGCVIDPAISRRVWLYNEYATAGNTWSTRVGHFALQNSRPEIPDPGAQTMDEGDTITLHFKVIEPDGEAIATFTALKKPTWSTFTKIGTDSGVLVLTPGFANAGIDTVRLRSTDNSIPVAADTVTFIITVQEKNAAPQISITPPDTVVVIPCCSLSVLITASDADNAPDPVAIFSGTIPAFAAFVDSGGGQGSLTVSPVTADVGIHSAQVLATDGLDTTSVTLVINVLPKGDLSGDGVLTSVDVVLELNCAFLGQPPPVQPGNCNACDFDGGGPTASDVVLLLNATFLGAPLPPC